MPTPIEIIIKGTDASGPAFKSVNQNIGALHTVVNQLPASLGLAARAFETMGVAISASGIAKLAVLGAEVKETQGIFKTLATQAGQSSVQVLNALRQASAGTASDSELMRASIKMNLTGLNISLDQMAQLMKAAKEHGSAMGIGTAEAFTAITTAVEYQQSRMLRQLGIVIDSTKAMKSYADANHVAVADMTEAQQQAVFLDATLKAVANTSGDLAQGMDDATEAMERMQTSGRNLADTLGVVLTPGLTKAADAATYFLDTVRMGVEAVFPDEGTKLKTRLMAVTKAYDSAARSRQEALDYNKSVGTRDAIPVPALDPKLLQDVEAARAAYNTFYQQQKDGATSATKAVDKLADAYANANPELVAAATYTRALKLADEELAASQARGWAAMRERVKDYEDAIAALVTAEKGILTGAVEKALTPTAVSAPDQRRNDLLKERSKLQQQVNDMENQPGKKRQTESRVDEINRELAALGPYQEKWDEFARRSEAVAGGTDPSAYGEKFKSMFEGLNMPAQKAADAFRNFSLASDPKGMQIYKDSGAFDDIVANVGDQIDQMIGKQLVMGEAFDQAMAKLPEDKKKALKDLGVAKLDDLTQTKLGVKKADNFDSTLAEINSSIRNNIPPEMYTTVHVTYTTDSTPDTAKASSDTYQNLKAAQLEKAESFAEGGTGTVSRSGYIYVDAGERYAFSGTRGQVPVGGDTYILQLGGQSAAPSARASRLIRELSDEVRKNR